MENYNLKGYNEIEKATTRSAKAEKSVRRIRKRFVDKLSAEAAEARWDREMERLMKEEAEKKAENPKYKKKTKKQLAEELKPKSTIINLEKFRTKEQEPMIMYFEPYGLPVYNLAGKKNGLEAWHREFIKENNDKVWEKRLEKERQEAEQIAAKLERKRAKKKTARPVILNEELKKQIGTGQIIDGTWKPGSGKKTKHRKGFYVGIEPLNLDNPIFKSKELLGTWRNYKTGRLFVDKVEHILDREKAIKTAKARGEIAIWDIAAAAEIRVDEENDRSL